MLAWPRCPSGIRSSIEASGRMSSPSFAKNCAAGSASPLGLTCSALSVDRATSPRTTEWPGEGASTVAMADLQASLGALASRDAVIDPEAVVAFGSTVPRCALSPEHETVRLIARTALAANFAERDRTPSTPSSSHSEVEQDAGDERRRPRRRRRHRSVTSPSGDPDRVTGQADRAGPAHMGYTTAACLPSVGPTLRPDEGEDG